MYLGIDLGTSGVKVVLIDDRRALVDAAHAALSVSRPQSGWSEQDPMNWIKACDAAVSELAARQAPAFGMLRGIGLSGQMHGATLLDRDDTPLRPAILWNDTRSGPQCAALEQRADFRGIGGNVVMAGFTAPKLQWLAEHEPDTFGKTAKVLLPKDFIRLWLTGEHVSDMSDAAGTLWLDVARRDWSEGLLAATGLTRDHMPRLVEGTEISGNLRAPLARAWGMSRVPVAGGGGDNAATACGMGVVAPGHGFLSLGTSGVVFAATERFAVNTDEAVHSFCHAVPATWHQMGVILSATDSLAWLGEIMGRSPAALIDLLPARIDRPSPLGFLPYLSGERTPHNDPDACGAFWGMRRDAGPADMVLAVLEGVAMAFADSVDALRRAGAAPEAVYAVGGGARAGQWLDVIAAITGVHLLKPEGGEVGAAAGAARLAMAATTGDVSNSVFARPAIASQVAPDPELAERYAAKRDAFRRLHPAISGAARP